MLLTTERARGAVPAEAARRRRGRVLTWPRAGARGGRGRARTRSAGRDVVAFGGGRVVDAAKAVAAADGAAVAAVPTTLAGSTFTPFHRMPAGLEGYGSARPGWPCAIPR